MTEAVVFDLDGTIADTVNLVKGNQRRVPYDALKVSGSGDRGAPLRFTDNREELPGELSAKGYRVALVTDSPAPYASTLADLLNIDFERLLAGGRRGKVSKLLQLAEDWDLDPVEMTYVGDRHRDSDSGDLDAADEVGCEYIPVEDIGVLRDLPPIRVSGGGVRAQVSSSNTTDDGKWITCPNRSCGQRNLRTIVERPALDGKCWSCRRNLASSRGGSAQSGLGGVDGEVARAFRELRSAPAQEDRRALQEQFLRGVSDNARGCVLDRSWEEGRFQFPPWLVSKTEMRRDGGLVRLVLTAASRLFPLLPPASQGGGWSGSLAVRTCVPYTGSNYGKFLMESIKDWKGMQKGSGPEVRQSLGHFIALVLAGHLLPIVEGERRGHREFCVVPMPSKACNPTNPGQFSARLAERVARYLGVECAPLLGYNQGKRTIGLDEGLSHEQRYLAAQRRLLLVDDQFTRGTSMKAAISSLAEGGYDVAAAMTWSRSGRESLRDGGPCFMRRHLDRSWGDCLCASRP